MGRYSLAIVMLSSLAIAQSSFAGAKSDQTTGTPSGLKAESASTLPPAPRGKTTVIGGVIRDVDPVRDQITLKVFGGRPMKILFDERTQVYRDGVKTALRDLHPEDHASVETVLDGTTIFALSIHMLSQSPVGECQGQVLSYNPATGELTVSASLSRQPIRLRVPPGVSVTGIGQAADSSGGAGRSDLVKGALISAKFVSGNDGRGVATAIAILAAPGSAFVFTGNISFLDLHSGTLAIVDPRDGKSYKISFDPAHFPISRELHQGAHVAVTANFDGDRYVATAITLK